jgi:hypothetical protein
LGRRSLGIRRHAGQCLKARAEKLRCGQTSITCYTTIELIGWDIMDDTIAVAAAIAAVSTLYATAG